MRFRGFVRLHLAPRPLGPHQSRQSPRPAPVGSVPGSSEASWVHLESPDPPLERKVFSGTFVPPPVSSCQVPSQPTSPVSDPRVDQLIEVVQQLFNRSVKMLWILVRPMMTVMLMMEEAVKELREKDIVDQRALLHLKLEPVPSDAASFRSWKNGFKVQLSKLDTSGQGLVT